MRTEFAKQTVISCDQRAGFFCIVAVLDHLIDLPAFEMPHRDFPGRAPCLEFLDYLRQSLRSRLMLNLPMMIAPL